MIGRRTATRWMRCAAVLVALVIAAPGQAGRSFIPIPEIILDPNEGTTLGLLPVVLFTGAFWFRPRCLLVRFASRAPLLVPGRAPSVLLHFPLQLTTLDPVSTRVLTFLFRVSRIVSPRLSGSPRIVPIRSAILSAFHARRLRMARQRREQERG